MEEEDKEFDVLTIDPSLFDTVTGKGQEVAP